MISPADSSILSRRRFVAVVAAVLAIVPLITWLSVRHSPNAGAATPPQTFAVLSRAAQTQDALPSEALADAATKIPIDRRAARALTASTTRTLELVPRTDGKICLLFMAVDGQWSGGCPATEQAAAQGIALTLPGDTIGLVPDGVRQVDVRLSDNTSMSVVPTSAGLYTAPSDAVEATFENAGVRQQVELIPASALHRIKGIQGSVAPNVLADFADIKASARLVEHRP